ncbi:unnamed protein product [Trichobilharzia szidati]|nr:unnamed protein product [Trichobilharzia szidati]
MSKTDSQHLPHGEFVPHDPAKSDLTVFVSNLDYSTTEDQLRKTFEKCGELTSVRLVRDYAGRSKGFAYVEFKHKDSVTAALALDRQPVVSDECFENNASSNLDNNLQDEKDQGTTTTTTTTVAESSKSSTPFKRPMFVSICDPSKVKASGFKYTVGKKEPGMLFLRNLDKNVKSGDLVRLFREYGLVSICLVTCPNGVPTGDAFIEFKSADDASRALIAIDGLQFGSKVLSVAISEPPVRQDASQSFKPPTMKSNETCETPQSDFTGGSSARKSRTQLEFLPRAIHRTHESQAGSDQTESSDDKGEVK